MTNCFSKLFFLLLAFYLFHQSDGTRTEGSNNWLKVKNYRGKEVFQVLGRSVIVPNGHRKKLNSSLKFSLGSSIVKVEPKNATLWKFHLEDRSLVDFSILADQPGTTEYALLWHGGGPNGPDREICFHPDFNDATWFDTYQPKDSAIWPMKIVQNQTRVPFNFLLDKFSEQVLELFFLNTNGFAVVVDENQPAFVRRQTGLDSLLCFSVNNDNYYPDNTDPSYMDIKVHLYAGANIRSVSNYVIAQSPHVPKPRIVPTADAFVRTSWLNYADKDGESYMNLLVQNGFNHGEILDLAGLNADSKRFFSVGLESIFPALVEHDFQLKYSVPKNIVPSGEHCWGSCYPPESERYRYLDVKDIRYAPGFIDYTVDFSNPAAVEWFAEERNRKLRNLRGRIHSVYAKIFGGYAGSNFKCHDAQYENYPNRLLGKYVETVAELKELNRSGFVSTRVAYKNQNLPVVVQLWMDGKYQTVTDYLQSLITHALSVSISGYSYFATNPIGSPSDGLTGELYIRWVQASTFMPHMTFYRSPWNYGQAVVNITRKFVNLHTKYAPLMIELAKERIHSGSPIVRPMWYAEPNNRAVYNIVDQFMVGNDLVVAPVLVAGKRERTVHLPPGFWVDQRGKRFWGARKVKVPVPLEELPYFTRIVI